MQGVDADDSNVERKASAVLTVISFGKNRRKNETCPAPARFAARKTRLRGWKEERLYGYSCVYPSPPTAPRDRVEGISFWRDTGTGCEIPDYETAHLWVANRSKLANLKDRRSGCEGAHDKQTKRKTTKQTPVGNTVLSIGCIERMCVA